MTTADELLASLGTLGIELRAEGGRLRFRAPPGALTPELRSALRAREREILGLLAGPAPAAPTGNDPPTESPAEFWRDWLGELAADGTLARHLGGRAERDARDLLGRDGGDGERARELVLRAMARVWDERHRRAGVDPGRGLR